MATVVKWLTHLAVNQTLEGSIPFGRPIREKKTLGSLFLRGEDLMQMF